jgi:hypothetical protein
LAADTRSWIDVSGEPAPTISSAGSREIITTGCMSAIASKGGLASAAWMA